MGGGGDAELTGARASKTSTSRAAGEADQNSSSLLSDLTVIETGVLMGRDLATDGFGSCTVTLARIATEVSGSAIARSTSSVIISRMDARGVSPSNWFT